MNLVLPHLTLLRYRQAEVDALEKDIAELEGDLHMFQENFDKATMEANMFSNLMNSIKENRAISIAIDSEEESAMALSQKYDTLWGAMKFKPALLKDPNFKFQYHGSSPKTCMMLSFQITSPTSVLCGAKVDATKYENPFTTESNRLATMSMFLQIRMADMCNKLCQTTLRSASDISPELRRVEWEMGRLEGTAKEIAVLKERYRSIVQFSRIDDSLLFQLKLTFTSQSGLRRLGASFQITEAYPFSPLDICLDSFDESIDVETLQKLLVKYAKPGFGYLSRICDILAASLPSGR
jgi:hypothetical protein